MDLQGKPLYQETGENACPICKEWKAKQRGAKRQLCQTCGKEIPAYKNVDAGYSSRVIDHWHDRKVSGIPGAHSVTKVLCKECTQAEYAKMYPGKKLDL